MSGSSKRVDGYEAVRNYILVKIGERACRIDPFVHISGTEIGEAVGISRQAVSEHIGKLVRRGLIRREGRCQYAAVEPVETVIVESASLTNGLRNLDETLTKGLQMLDEHLTEADAGESRSLTNALRNLDESLTNGLRNDENCSKNKYQEKENEIKKEKCVDFLGDWVDVTDERYLKAYAYAEKMFNRYGAGVRKGTSPALINRFVAGFTLGIPLINFPELEEQLKEAQQETALYESFKGFGKQSGIRRPYIRIANYLKKCFEAAGWVWTPCTSPFEHRLKKAHRKKKATPIFPQLESDLKPQPGSTTVFQDGHVSGMTPERPLLPLENPLIEQAAKQLGEAFRLPPEKPKQ